MYACVVTVGGGRTLVHFCLACLRAHVQRSHVIPSTDGDGPRDASLKPLSSATRKWAGVPQGKEAGRQRREETLRMHPRNTNIWLSNFFSFLPTTLYRRNWMHQHRCSTCKCRQCDLKLRGAPGRRRQCLSCPASRLHTSSSHTAWCALFISTTKAFSTSRNLFRVAFCRRKLSLPPIKTWGPTKQHAKVNLHILLPNTHSYFVFNVKVLKCT